MLDALKIIGKHANIALEAIHELEKISDDVVTDYAKTCYAQICAIFAIHGLLGGYVFTKITKLPTFGRAYECSNGTCFCSEI
jgi:hypothetical protein